MLWAFFPGALPKNRKGGVFSAFETRVGPPGRNSQRTFHMGAFLGGISLENRVYNPFFTSIFFFFYTLCFFVLGATLFRDPLWFFFLPYAAPSLIFVGCGLFSFEIGIAFLPPRGVGAIREMINFGCAGHVFVKTGKNIRKL
ncbi:hypothetical protein UF32_23275 [Vibrio parahaemolyticus]|nr:hypothetical protein UF32_23275 [Vibrio parahaemolyticus]